MLPSAAFGGFSTLSPTERTQLIIADPEDQQSSRGNKKKLNNLHSTGARVAGHLGLCLWALTLGFAEHYQRRYLFNGAEEGL